MDAAAAGRLWQALWAEWCVTTWLDDVGVVIRGAICWDTALTEEVAGVGRCWLTPARGAGSLRPVSGGGVVLLLAMVLGAPLPGATAPGARVGGGLVLPGLALMLLVLLLVCELP